MVRKGIGCSRRKICRNISKYFVLSFLISSQVFAEHSKVRLERISENNKAFTELLYVLLDSINTAYSQIPKLKNIKIKLSGFSRIIRRMVKKDKKFNVVAAIKNEKVVGGIIFTRKKPDFVYIDLIGVSPEFWGKGIGTKLIKNIKKFFPKTKKLALVVRRANLPAILFYEKLGFEITDFTQPGYSRTHFVGMENKPTTIQA